MGLIILCIFSLFFLSSCMSDGPEETELTPTEICCIQSSVEDIQRNDSAKSTREWGGVDPNADYLPTTYPLDSIYLMVQKGEYEWESLPIPIQKSGDRRFFEICFRADEDGNVYAMSDGVTKQVGPDKTCFFSSVPNEYVELTESTILTPGNKTTYEPCGDNIFRSENLNFMYAKDKKTKKFKVQSILEKDVGQKQPSPVELSLNRIRMYRGTFVVIPRLTICDGYPNPEEETALGGTYELTEADFKTKLGINSMDDLSVRFFLAGKKGDDEAFPTEIDLTYLGLDWKGYVIGTTDYSYTKGVVALTENNLPMKAMEDKLTSLGGKNFNYLGFGVHDASFPFLYKGDTYLDEFDLCCTIYRHTDPSSSITIRFPMNDLSVNDVHILGYVIDVDDVAQGLGVNNTAQSKQSRSVIREYDDFFGEIVEIPTVFIRN